jgi:hypothetical protein
MRISSVITPHPPTDQQLETHVVNHRAFFRNAKVLGGMPRQEKSSDIGFIVWSWGLVTGGASISYVYCGEPKDGYPHTLFTCIHQNKLAAKADNKQRLRHEQLDGNWYFFQLRD